MRNFCKTSLSLALVVLLASPALAQRQRQRQGGGGFGQSLLLNKSVQEELKITKEQKEKLDPASKKVQEKMQEELPKLRDLKAGVQENADSTGVDLYSALRPLDEITGATTADDILNLIFSTFCVGK